VTEILKSYLRSKWIVIHFPERLQNAIAGEF